MAEPGKPQPDGLDKAKVKQYLVPAAALAAVVVLAGLVIYVSDASAQKMSDGSNDAADDPDLKEITPGVKSRDVKTGVGEPCPAGAEVKIHYKGWLTDGTVFDTKQAITFPLNRLIKGWQEGIPGMKPGGIRKLVIAPDKGYGNQKKDNIPANSTLIFEVELLYFTPPAPTPPAGPKPKLSDGTDPNAADSGLKDIGGGLMVRDIKEGAGEPVKEGATVTIHYTGWLQNGDVFDNSRPRGKPNTFPLPNLIKGWQKGIPGMKPGGIRKLVVPPELGYGAGGQGDIPGGATLVFEVELIN